jgi:sulfite oxidase
MTVMGTPTDRAAEKEQGFRVLDPVWFNAGPEPSRLGETLLTPVPRFFARNHGAIPEIKDPGAWTVSVEGLVDRPLRWRVAELRKGRFPEASVPATLVCAGLRRTELMAHREVPGELGWGLEPVGTATWTGVRLADLLDAVGVKPEARHVELLGGDDVERHGHHFGFGGSVPLAKARSPEVLLAWAMNGAPLPAVHGGPLRLVVPGYIGARSVKWLTRIVLRETPSENYFQRDAYRVLREPRPEAPREVRTGEELGEVPLNAVILSPEAGTRVAAGPLEIRGWALGQGGAAVTQVEVSTDDGQTWTPATLEAGDGTWAWRFWRARVTVAPGRTVLVARARDAAGHAMPASVAEVWNVKGYGNNAWHRVPLEVTA